MSHQALQRVIVRMLYDPALADAVIAAPRAALAGVDLNDAELGWLTEADPRAFKTDPYRRARSLRALLEEYPVSAALSPGRPQQLDRFFSSQRFHAAIQDRGSMATSFGDWLLAPPERRPEGGFAHPGADAVLQRSPRDACALLERAVVRARRPERPSLPPAHIAPAPQAVLVRLPAGTLAFYARIRGQLGPAPVAALLSADAAVRPPPLLRQQVADATQEELALVTLTDDEVSVEVAADWLVPLLRHPPAPRPDWLAAARDLGADPGEDAELIDDLIAQALLISG